MKEAKRYHLEGRIIEMDQSRIYVQTKKLHTKIMQEEHDVPMVGHHGEQTMKVAIWKKSTFQDD